MKYINPNSKSGIINKFADFIVNHIDEKFNSIIEVSYLGNFFIIKGITESDSILNLQQIKESFIEKYNYLLSANGINSINLIDIIQYNQKIISGDFNFKLYKSDTPKFNQNVINHVRNNSLNPNIESIDYDICILKEITSIITAEENEINNLNQMSLKSEFPYGYSLGYGRLKLFYSEYIVNQIFNLINVDQIIFGFSDKKDNNGDLNIRIFSDSYLNENKIRSLILDVFDFNISKFKNEYLKDFDIEYEIENQLSPRNWYIKDRTKDLILF